MSCWSTCAPWRKDPKTATLHFLKSKNIFESAYFLFYKNFELELVSNQINKAGTIAMAFHLIH
jgi:hypothetical protein